MMRCRCLYTDRLRMPLAETQMATVLSNADPHGAGRVQVRMNWQTDNMRTSWVRVMTPDGGGSKDVKSNRGFVFIPEVGDQVLLGFRHGDPARPYVLGSLFNGTTGNGGGSNNSIKSLKTRSGISVILNDDNKSLTIKDAGGSSIHLDGNGNILLNAPKDIQLHAGNDMSLMVGHDLQVNVGNSQTTNIGNMMLTNVMQKILVNTPFMQQLVADFFHTQAGKALLNSQNQIKIEAPETNVVGEQELFIHSANKTVVNSQGTMEMRGEQGMHELNTAKEYETVKEEIGTKVCVQFRTSESYSGEFGFDWVRIADSSRIGDKRANRYDKIIGTCEGNGYNFKQETNKYIQFLTEYKQQYIIPWKKKSKNLYVVPVMTLMQGRSAKLVLNIDVFETPKTLKYEYDESLFSLSTDTVKNYKKGKHKEGDKLEILCKQEFSEDKQISIYAYDEKEEKSLAGKLIIKANDKKHRYVLKVILVRVKCKIRENPDEEPTQPIQNPDYKTKLEKYFAQCYIETEIKECELDLTTDKNKKGFTTFTSNGKIKQDTIDNGLIFDYLTTIMNNNEDTLKYMDFHKIFLFDELSEEIGLCGQTRNIPAKEVIVLKLGLYDSTMVHELFHALGLHHSFNSLNKYVFKQYKTDNIMDYSDMKGIPVISTWQFQWDMLHRELQTVDEIINESKNK